MSSEKAPARRVGGERPRVMLGRRREHAGLSNDLPEAAIMSSEKAPARRVGGERPRVVYRNLGIALSYADMETNEL